MPFELTKLRLRLMPWAFVVLGILASYNPLAAGIKQLGDSERAALAGVADDEGVRDHAFGVLVEHARQWTREPDGTMDIGSEAVRLRPDLNAIAAQPGVYRGELCIVEGVVQQTVDDGTQVFEVWVRDDTGSPCVVMVVDDSVPANGRRVRLVCRFLKSVRLTARDGGERGYPLFIGRVHGDLAEPIGNSGVVNVLLPLGLATAVALVAFALVLLYVRRTSSGRNQSRGTRRSVNEPEFDLPGDPAEALEVLKSASEGEGRAEQ